MSHTYAIMAVSHSTHKEVSELLKAAGYDHAFQNDSAEGPVLDMHGIAIALDVHKQDPISQKDDGFYFSDETWDYRMGPYETRGMAELAMTLYCNTELAGRTLEQMILDLHKLSPKWI